MKRCFMLVLTFLALIILYSVKSVPTVHAAGCEASNIIFSEIDYDMPGNDDAEFLELRIIDATTISDCEIRLISGNNDTSPVVYATIDLTGTYSADKYLVIGEGAITRDLDLGSQIQNGPRDGFALVDTSGSGSVIWIYSYEGTFTNYDPGDGSSNNSTPIN